MAAPQLTGGNMRNGHMQKTASACERRSICPGSAAKRWLSGERGISTVELALALPLLLALVCGLIEVGYAYFASASMDKAAQAGARVAVTGAGYDDGTRMSLIENKVMSTVNTFAGKGTIGMEVSSFPVASPGAVSSGAGGPCDIVQIDVTYSYAPITPIAGPIFGPTITVHGTDRMINEPWMTCD